MRFTRITVNPAQMGGTPCIRGLRIPVATVMGMIADGMSVDKVTNELPDLGREDVREALRFTAEAILERQLLAPHSALRSVDSPSTRADALTGGSKKPRS
ncbi:DUF433 domain-containing protein [Protofrankia symbiont of Coriaria ruscifolia]|uniref:DUF433 domain-containing protein n=1 Tax=Protofrankia symbiont of Coriaria ruscifolia TaxID=1306542 RepID=UPI001040F339|nr:DUF433 domain-containing protein [Protofrankia symbiont of Coriaria ruscifolia]